MKVLFASCALLLLCACPAASTKCEPDGGTVPVDAGEPEAELQFRFVNLGREGVVVQLEGEDAGRAVSPLDSLLKTGHVTLIKQRGTVEARNFLADGGRQAVVLPFEFDPVDGESVTFVLKDTTPARISMNVTVGKQTQGATFGEKVKSALAGVEVEGGVDTEGDCSAEYSPLAGTPARVGLRADPDDADCPGTADDFFVRPGDVDPEATPYFVHGADGELAVAWVSKISNGLHVAGGSLAQGRLIAAALLGSGRVSKPTRRLYVLNAHSSGQSASVTVDGVAIAANLAPGALLRVKTSLAAAVERKAVTATGQRRGQPVSVSVGGVNGAFVLGSDTGPCKPPYLCDEDDTLIVVSENLDSPATVMRSIHDEKKSVLGVIRREIALSTTSSIDTQGCVSLFPGDDTCVVGTAVVTSVSSLAGGAGGGAAAASYARMGQLLYPPKVAPAGVAMRFSVEEAGIVANRFLWDNPAGLTPSTGKSAGGFAIVASGAVLDATATPKRALLFVNTSVSPWTVQGSLSR